MSFSRTSHSNQLLPPLWVLTLVLLFAAGWVMYQLKELLVLIVLGYSIAYVLSPVLDWLERKGVRRSFGVFVVLIALVALLAVLLATAVPTITREYDRFADNLPEYVQAAKERLQPAITWVDQYFPVSAVLEGERAPLLSLIPEIDQSLVRRTMAAVVETLSRGYNLTLFFVNLLLLPFIVYYLAVDFHTINRAVLRLFPVIQQRKVIAIARDIDRYVSQYVRGQLLVGFSMFVCFAIALGLVGVELWFLLAVISGFGNIIPYVGSIVGILLTTLMTLVTFGDLTHVLIVWAIFGGVQFLEGTFFTPNIIGESTGFSPLVVILAILAGGMLFGILGIFLAVPVLAILRVLSENMHGWIVHRALRMGS